MLSSKEPFDEMAGNVSKPEAVVLEIFCFDYLIFL